MRITLMLQQELILSTNTSMINADNFNVTTGTIFFQPERCND